MTMNGAKLARAASQQLKGVVIEYDALCSTLIGRTRMEQAEEQRRKEAQRQQEEREREASSGGGLFSRMVSGMFVNDVRSMLKDLQQDSTGKPWVVKDRLQSTLQGLPTDVLERVTGDKPSGAVSGKTEEEQYLEKQLASASEEIERMKERRAVDKEDALKKRLAAVGSAGSGGGSSARDKYLDKINKLKAKAQARDPNEALAAFTGVSPDTSDASPAKGLTTWIVNKGANELLTYATLRGLVKAVTPPRSDLQREEYEVFCKEMEAQFDYFMTLEEYEQLPDSGPFTRMCKDLDLSPVETVVIGRHPTTIRAARAARAHTCHFMKSESEIPNHSADYQLTNLKEFQYIVEDFNGISYRGRVIH